MLHKRIKIENDMKKPKRIDNITKKKIAMDYLTSQLTQVQIAAKWSITILTLQRILRAFHEHKLEDAK